MDCILTVLIFICLILSAVFLIAAWPISVILVSAIATYWLLKKYRAVWSAAISEVLLSVIVGLGLVALCQAFVNLYGKFIEPKRVLAVEEYLIQLRYGFQEAIDLPWPFYLVLLACLLAINSLYGKARLLSRFLALKRLAAGFLVVLTTLVSFTFFSRVPLHEVADKSHDERIKRSESSTYRYRAQLRDALDEVATYLAVEEIAQGVAETTEQERQVWRTVFETIDKNSTISLDMNLDDSGLLFGRDRALRQMRVRDLQQQGRLPMLGHMFEKPVLNLSEDVAARLADEHVKRIREKALGSSEPQRIVQEIVETAAQREIKPEKIMASPKDFSGWQAQGKWLTEQQLRVEKLESEVEELRGKSNAAVAALTEIFSEAVGLATPRVQGLPGVFLEKLVTDYAAHFFKPKAAEWLGSARGAVSHMSAKLTELTESIAHRPGMTWQYVNPASMLGEITLGKHLSVRRFREQVVALTRDIRADVKARLSSSVPTLEEGLRLRIRDRGFSLEQFRRERMRMREIMRRGRARGARR